MALQMISNDDSIYLSAPTTPTSPYLNFYSAPTTPILHAYKPTFDHDQSEPATPKGCAYDYYYHDEYYEDANNSFIEFEFETSRRYAPDDCDFDQMVQCFEYSPVCQKKQEQHQRKESLPAMAFADELFCDGKVMPLKPPPRLQKGSCNNVSYCLSSPKSPTAALKLPFPRRSLWNDDFDPFMVALENVKKGDIENMEMRNKEKDHRRARSMSPKRAESPQRPSKSMSFHHPEIINRSGPDQSIQMEPDGPHSIWVPFKNRRMEKESKRLGESKGLSCARQTRLVKMGHEKARTGEGGGKESEESCSRESKRQRIMKRLFKSASSGRPNNEEKQKDQPVKKSFTRKFSFRSTGNNGIAAQCNEEKRVSQVTKVTVMQYRPRLFICMGYGAKYAK